MALPAFARRTPRCGAPCSNRFIFPAGRATAANFAVWQTDRRTPGRFIDPALHTMRAVSIITSGHNKQLENKGRIIATPLTRTTRVSVFVKNFSI